MPRAAATSSHRFAFRPLAVAVSLALCATLPAQAQFYSYSGAINTPPANVNAALFDLGGGTLQVGNGAPGSFSALTGALMRAGLLDIANGGSGTGTVDVSGPNALVELSGTSFQRLNVGSWGIGTMTVSGGGVVDATVNAAACTAPGAGCNVQVGNGAGSTATLTITGLGSELRSLRNFSVGHQAVFTVANGGFDFGTPGGTTNAFVNVLAGGSLRTERATVGLFTLEPGNLGTEKAFGTVLVDGAGSKWVLTHNSIDNQAAGLTLANHANATATVTVSNGGKLLIDGTGGPGPNDFLNIAVNGGKGTLTVTGAGSSVDVVGKNTVINVGRSGAGAQGSFSVLAGATASALYVNVGRDGASGTMLIDGVGSKLSQVGVGSNQSPGLNGPAYTYIGREGGQGLVTVSGGGEWLMSQGVGGDGTLSGNGLGMGLGRGANSSGTLLITGDGSKVEIVSTSINPGAGVGDNRNPSVDVGYDTPGTSSGTLRVENRGKLVLTGNAVSTQADGRTTALNIGGRSGTAARGTATVTGAGSEIIVQGYDALINVGREAGGNGTLNVLAGGKVSSTSLAVGISGTGTVNIDNASIALSGNRSNTDPLVGAASTFGRGVGGSGALNMSNGASFTITPSVSNGGLGFGGDIFLPGGTATLTMSGASSIVVNGPLSGNAVTIGRTGTATADLSGASSITVTNGNLYVGREAGGVGVLNMSGGSTVNAGYVGVGRTLGAEGGAGTLNLTDSTVNASRFEIGTAGIANVNTGGRLNISNSNAALANPIIDRSVYVAGQVGSTGTLLMSGNTDGGAVLNAGFVGIGVGQAGTTRSTLGTPGGTGTLVLNNSTINTTRFELGAGSLLTGDGGVINAGANGPVIIGGTISPGNSPGRLRINCDITMLFGSKLILEIDNSGGQVEIDQLIIGEDSNFDLFQTQIIFSFIGINPADVVLDLNEFLRAGKTGSNETSGLQALFEQNGLANWDEVVNQSNFAFQSSEFDVTGFKFNAETGLISGVEASAIPEPASIALVLLALMSMVALSRRRASRRV